MPRKSTSTSTSYTIQLFRIGSDQNEIGLLFINFRADNLASAQAQAMVYLKNHAFVEDIDGAKLLRRGVALVQGERYLKWRLPSQTPNAAERSYSAWVALCFPRGRKRP
jgi:hypothetical protein